jgi:gamma-glutamyltranspeptidase/glutathione hydrolase
MCRDGFKVTPTLAKIIKQSENYIRSDFGLSEIYLNKQTREIFKENDIIKNINLAKTLEIISKENITAFYNGSLTQIMVNEMNDKGAKVSLEDFNNYRALVKKTIEVNIDDNFKILSQPPPSSGILVSFIIKLMSSKIYFNNN